MTPQKFDIEDTMLKGFLMLLAAPLIGLLAGLMIGGRWLLKFTWVQAVVPFFVLLFLLVFLFALVGDVQKDLLTWSVLGSWVLAGWWIWRGGFRGNQPMKKSRDLDGFFAGYYGKQPWGKYRTQDGHILVVGGPGSGKSACLVIPTLKYFWKGRFLAVDIKGELAEKSHRPGLRFNPSDPDAPGYNPFYLAKETDDLISYMREIALTLIPKPAEVKEPYWIESAQNILMAHLVFSYRQGAGFYQALQTLQRFPVQDLVDTFLEEPDIGMFVRQFEGQKPEHMASIMSEVANHVLPFLTDKSLERALTKPEDKVITPDELEKGFDIFLQIPEHKLNQWKSLIALILQQFLNHFERRGEGNQEPILFLIDEFPRFGKIQAVVDGLATLRSKKISICLVVQSLAQLDSIYGAEMRKVIADNCNYKGVLAATDADTQKYFSALVGTTLQEQYSETQDEKPIFFKQTASSSRTLIEKAIIKPEQLAYLGREGKLLWLSPESGHQLLEKRRYDQITKEKPIYSASPERRAKVSGTATGKPETVKPAPTSTV